jgi:hypothetical protein
MIKIIIKATYNLDIFVGPETVVHLGADEFEQPVEIVSRLSIHVMGLAQHLQRQGRRTENVTKTQHTVGCTHRLFHPTFHVK